MIFKTTAATILARLGITEVAVSKYSHTNAGKGHGAPGPGIPGELPPPTQYLN